MPKIASTQPSPRGRASATRTMSNVELQRLGIAAHAVLDTHELLHDAQLESRGFIVRIAHPEFGATAIEGSRFLLSAAPALRPESAVSYGSHNATVLRDILHYTDARIAQLTAQGALQ